MPRALKVGDPAPLFELPKPDGTIFKLKDVIGKKNLVIYFYPKDNTTVCTKEACEFRNSYAQFKDADAEIIGISTDDEKSHTDFAAQYQLPFVLLSDLKGVVHSQYGIPAAFKVLHGRSTFVVDKHGIIRNITRSAFNANRHIEEALEAIRKI